MTRTPIDSAIAMLARWKILRETLEHPVTREMLRKNIISIWSFEDHEIDEIVNRVMGN